MKRRRIAIVTGSFADSTLPLMKNLCQYGFDVDLYYCVFNKHTKVATGFDFSVGKIMKYGGIYELDYGKSLGCDFIKQFPDSHIYVYQGMNTGGNSTGVKRFLAGFACKVMLRNLANVINHGCYDLVEFIGPAVFTIWLHKLLKVKDVLMSFHEVFFNHIDKKSLHPVVKYAISHKLRIRTFSESVKNDVLRYSDTTGINIMTIPFGLYTCYRDFDQETSQITLPFSKYILFSGFIVPYKGLSFLFESIKTELDNGEINLVIAGKGYDEALQKFAGRSNVLIINRWISNSELIFLIRNSKFVVCPYLSASQSGLPQTAFVYNKPVIATNVGGFSGIIDEGKSGYLVDKNNVIQLREKIMKLYSNEVIYNSMEKYISNFENEKKNFSWSSIVLKYVEFNNLK